MTALQPVDTAALAEAVTGAAGRIGILAAWGSHWGRRPPPGKYAGLELTAMDKILDFSTGDLTCRVEIGIGHQGLTRRLSEAGLEWPLQPLPGQTDLAQTYLSGAAYADSALFPNPRDWILGGTLVSGRGEIVTTGGATVKNSAGYDLARSCFGSMGLVAAPAQLQLRLRPHPEQRTRLRANAPGPRHYLAVLDEVRRQLDVVDGFQIGGGGGPSWIRLVLAGPRDRVREASAALQPLCPDLDSDHFPVAAAAADWDGCRYRIGLPAHQMADFFGGAATRFWAFPLQRLAYASDPANEWAHTNCAAQLLPLPDPQRLRERVGLLCRGLDPDERFV